MEIEAKLGLNVFKIDTEPHIIIDQGICQEQCVVRVCLHICPAELYSLNQEGEVQVDYEGCLECGTCLIACDHGALAWHYPRPGFGVQYRFG
jgi:ferredoxin like protein